MPKEKFLDQAHLTSYEKTSSRIEESEASQHGPKDTDAPISPPTPDQNEQQSSSAAVVYMRRSSSYIPMSQRRVWCLMEYPRSRPLRCRVPASASDIPAAEAELLLAAFWFRSDDVPKRAVLSKFAEHRMKEEQQEAKAARELLMADDREYEDVSRRPHEEDMFGQSYEEDVSNTPTCRRGIEDTGSVSGFRPVTPSSPSLLSLLIAVVTCTSCWTSARLQQDQVPGLAGRHEAGEAGEQQQGSDRMRQPPTCRSFRRPIKAHLPFPGDAFDPLHVPLLVGSGSEAEGIQRLLHPHHQCHSKAPGRHRSGD